MYTPEEIAYFKEEIISRMLEGRGKSLLRIFEEDTDMELCSRKMVYEWLNPHNDKYDPEFSDNYAQACADRAEKLVEETIDIADDSSGDEIITEDGRRIFNKEFAARSNLRVQTRQWIAARMQPKKYGKKVETTIQGGDKPVEIIDYTKLSSEALEEINKLRNESKS